MRRPEFTKGDTSLSLTPYQNGGAPPLAPENAAEPFPLTQDPMRGRAETRARRRRAAPKRRGGRRARFSKPQIALLCLLLCALAALGAVNVVYSARLADLDNRRAEEKADYERRVWRTTVKNRDIITKYAAEYAVHPAYVAAIILNESSYDPYAVSSADARGLMQLLPSTGEWIAPKIGISKSDYTADILYDPDVNVHMGAWYIGYLCGRYDGDPILIACAYHAGAGNVDSWISNYSSDGKTLTYDQIPYDNSRSYARKVVNSYAIYLENYYKD